MFSDQEEKDYSDCNTDTDPSWSFRNDFKWDQCESMKSDIILKL